MGAVAAATPDMTAPSSVATPASLAAASVTAVATRTATAVASRSTARRATASRSTAQQGYGPQAGYGQPGGYAQQAGYGRAGGPGAADAYAQRGGYPANGYGTDGYGQQAGYAGPAGGEQEFREAPAGPDAYDRLGLGDGDGRGGAFGGLAGFLQRPGGGRRGSRRRGGNRRSAMSVPVLAVVAVVASIAVVAASVGVDRMLTAKTAAAAAPAANVNCTLIVPANPLSAQGLATPYQLVATNAADGPCNEANGNQTAFVQGAIINPRTGRISIYDPLVVDAGTQAAAAPVVPALPTGAVVALWFGYNGNTLSLAGPDQAQALIAAAAAAAASASATASATAATPTAAATATSTPAAAATATGTPTAAPSATDTGTATATATPTAAPSATDTGTATATATPTTAPSPTQSAPSSPAAAVTAPATAAATQQAAVQAEGAAPLSPASGGSEGYSATLTRVTQFGQGAKVSGYHHHHPASQSGSPSASASAPQSAPASVAASPSTQATQSAAAAPSTGAGTGTGTSTMPPASAGDAPAASATPDTFLQQANCVAGENINGQFSSFTQVGACNAAAFFRAANRAIRAGRLRVPPLGTAADGQQCLTTRSFAAIDQDQSDNVTTEYLANANGQIAQDTAANRQGLAGAATLFNGSDNGLIDLFIDPTLGCTPWEVPNLADGGALAPSLPLDELQAARYAGRNGNPAALVPLNDPMTLDGNGNFSTDKTNTYRSLVDMPPLPAGQSPTAYCTDMEQIQTTRIQQDFNLLTKNPGPAPDAASNLFNFLAMRLQQSFQNLNCGSLGLQNDVSTTTDGNGVVVAACFTNPVAPTTPGAGNPMAGTTTCPATTASSSSGTQGQPGNGSGTPSPGQATPSATPSATSSGARYHHKRHHWWW